MDIHEISLVSMPSNFDAIIMAVCAGMVTSEQALEELSFSRPLLLQQINGEVKPLALLPKSPQPQLHPIMADKRRKIVLED